MPPAVPLGLDLVERAVAQAAVRYDRDGDQHYDVISAFIKSVRGSDVDAALHYLARMIEAGEDPRFIARRLMILASEDIGMADPTLAAPSRSSAATAVALIGFPEGRIILAQAVIHLSLAPKSNAVVVAIDEAQADLRRGLVGTVPAHLRDAHYQGAARVGHGGGYRYPHDDPAGVVAQDYAPDPVRRSPLLPADPPRQGGDVRGRGRRPCGRRCGRRRGGRRRPVPRTRLR